MDISAIWHAVAGYLWIPALIALVLGYKLVLRVVGVVMIAEDQIGIVNKKFKLVGSNRTLPDGSIVALNGEAGLQADTLAPGVHFWLWPWQYEITRQGFVTIKDGSIGVVVSRDGKPLSDGRVLCKKVMCNSFQDARAFLMNGGERGPQITIIPPGTYRINTALFNVTAEPVLEIPDNKVGVVTTKEGKPLKKGDIAGPIIGDEKNGHNSFQDAQTFIDMGGVKGMQEQVILAGRYFINPEFAQVEIRDMSIVPIASVGVIISFVGEDGQDVSGSDFKHGNLVKKGQKGVWVESLDPGKYPVNPTTHKVEVVSTSNIVLNWADSKTESHKLDENLSTITVRSSDGFKFNLDVSQIIHIPSTDAPKVIARFGSVANMVTQVLEPTIGNYFRNAAQSSDAIDFLKSRKDRQDDAREKIAEALKEYNVVAVDTLIGDIVPPEELMKTLTDRKIAEQEKVTFETQRQAQVTRKDLEQATAIANTQARVVDAERTVTINEFAAKAAVAKAEGEADAAVKKAEGDAKARKLSAEGEANYVETVGKATAASTLAVGKAEAEVIEKKTQAVGQGNYAMIEIGKALAANKVKLVPDIIAGGSGSGGDGMGMVNALLGTMIKDKLAAGAAAPEEAPKPAAVEAAKPAAPAKEEKPAAGPEKK